MVDITKGRDAQQKKTEITNTLPFFVLLLPGTADPEDSFDLVRVFAAQPKMLDQ